MDTTAKLTDWQAAMRLQGRIDSFFDNCTIGTLLHRCGIRKARGASPLAIVKAIFALPFKGQNFYRGIVQATDLGFRKDAAYDVLSNPKANWRRLLLLLSSMLVRALSLLTSEERVEVLVLDDSLYDRATSKKVELLSRVYDHSDNRYRNGFRMLTLGWSDGASFLPLDFALLAGSEKKESLVHGEVKEVDRRTSGARRRKEAREKATVLAGKMVARVLACCPKVSYILMDSWFAFPSIIKDLDRHKPVICMLKDLANIQYLHHNCLVRLSELYRQVRKKPGKAVILASVQVAFADGTPVKIVFVRHRRKRDWLALLSTDLNLSDEEIVRLYGRRWSIEVFFRTIKHFLNLERETQMRDYDGLVGHASIVMIRSMFLTFEQRLNDDPRALGELFHACCQEVKDITVAESLQLVLTLLRDRLSKAGVVIDEVIGRLIDETFGAVMMMCGLKSKFPGKKLEFSSC